VTGHPRRSPADGEPGLVQNIELAGVDKVDGSRSAKRQSPSRATPHPTADALLAGRTPTETSTVTPALEVVDALRDILDRYNRGVITAVHAAHESFIVSGSFYLEVARLASTG